MTEARVGAHLARIGALRAEIAKVIVGQEEVIEQLLIGALRRRPRLLEGVPGLAKTLLVRTLAERWT